MTQLLRCERMRAVRGVIVVGGGEVWVGEWRVCVMLGGREKMELQRRGGGGTYLIDIFANNMSLTHKPVRAVSSCTTQDSRSL